MARGRDISPVNYLYRLNYPKTLKMVQEKYPMVAPPPEVQNPTTSNQGQVPGIAALIARLPVLVLAWDDQGQLILWNLEAEKLSGFEIQELLSETGLAARVLGANFVSQVQEYWQGHTSEPPTWREELLAKDGRRYLMLWSLPARRLQVPGWRWWVMGLPVSYGGEAEAV